ncbi:MAG: ribonuclease P protein component 1 [Thermococcus sp.]|uniref:ribonuclease P protein component 1 n=1 Tax=Thermococcus sp. TaxID=35749 RepID=UPI0017DF1C19|nr:ribonuclease P protein component 1 [Thermococcus sp.]MCD6139830.1 ribonuclease P protein component 1 [Thermococcus sp.]MCD6144619.1 ribonuclease P protein component 1 [Thermococcus sp.]HDG63867.1 ribonuclease P protein component 1 [Thermococcus sp.]
MWRNSQKWKNRASRRPQRKGEALIGKLWIFRGLDRGRMTKKTLLMHELIGLKVKVIKSSHPGLIGIEGYVIDETKNTLTILGTKVWAIPKIVAEFEFEVGDKKIRIKGEELVGRPEMRLKKR